MALRVDFSSGLCVKERLKDLMFTSEFEEQQTKPVESYGSVEDGENNGSSHQHEEVIKNDTSTPDDRPLWIGCGVTAGDIRHDLPNDPTKAEKVILVLKLCLGQLATGQATVDAENYAMQVADAIGLGKLRIDLGPRRLMVGCGGHSTIHMLDAQRGIVLDKLAQITDLVILLGNGYTQDAAAANKVLDEIMESPTPYGWLVDSYFFWMLSTLAATCAFFGSYYDMAIVCVIVFIVAILQQVIGKFPETLGSIDVILVSIAVGVCSSFSWRYIMKPLLDAPACNVSVLFLSPLLVYLPGSELIYGAYEIKMGSIIVGGSRLVSATVRCMYMASGLTIGWQVFGHNIFRENKDTDDVRGSSLVPSSQCAPFTSDEITPYNVGPWWLVFVVYNLVLLIPCFGGLNIRPKHFLGNYLVAYPTLVLFGYLNFGCTEAGCGLPSYIINMIGLFVATSLACVREFVTGIPVVHGLIPVLLVLAPGSTAVIEMLKLMQATNGVNNLGSTTDIFVELAFLGVSYALGMVLAFALWDPILSLWQKKHITTAAKERSKMRRSSVIVFDKF